MTTISARNVTRTYAGDAATIDAVRGIDLEIGAGEYVAISGPSGSGKSTLLHLLGGLDEPSSGDVLIDGVSLRGLSRDKLAHVRNRSIGFVFQFFNLLPSLTVEENVTLPALIAGDRASCYGTKVADLLETVGLASKRHRYPAQLSGGEQQRVAIARALIMNPAVVLADEPTGNLDTHTGNDILRLLGDCHARGQTVILVTHDVRVATQTQRVVFLRDGALVEETRLRTPTDREQTISRMIAVDDGSADVEGLP